MILQPMKLLLAVVLGYLSLLPNTTSVIAQSASQSKPLTTTCSPLTRLKPPSRSGPPSQISRRAGGWQGGRNSAKSKSVDGSDSQCYDFLDDHVHAGAGTTGSRRIQCLWYFYYDRHTISNELDTTKEKEKNNNRIDWIRRNECPGVLSSNLVSTTIKRFGIGGFNRISQKISELLNEATLATALLVNATESILLDTLISIQKKVAVSEN